jgi:MatE
MNAGKLLRSAVRSIAITVGPLTLLASPFMCISLVKEAAAISSLIFVGRIGATALGAVTLGDMVCNITGFSVLFGFNSSLDALISQAWGARAYALGGFYAERAAILISISCLPIAIIWYNSRLILHNVLMVPFATAHVASVWSRLMILGLWPCMMSDVLRRWLQGQHVVWPTVSAAVISTAFNIVTFHFLVDFLSLPRTLEVAAIIYVLTKWCNFGALVVLVCIRELCLMAAIKQRNTQLDMAEGSVGVGEVVKETVTSTSALSAAREGRMIAPFEPLICSFFSWTGTEIISPLSSSSNLADPKSGESDVKCSGSDRSERVAVIEPAAPLLQLNNDSPDHSPVRAHTQGENLSTTWRESAHVQDGATLSYQSPSHVPTQKLYESETAQGKNVSLLDDGWGQFLRLGLPGALSVCLEW